MVKYIILGILNIFWGITLAILVIILAVGIIPQLNDLYTQLSINNQLSIKAYIGLVVLFITAAINIFLGIRLIWGSIAEKQKYFVPGIIWGVASLVLPAFIIVPTVIIPIFGLLYSVE